jgi:hypothetical protein
MLTSNTIHVIPLMKAPLADPLQYGITRVQSGQLKIEMPTSHLPDRGAKGKH